MLACDVKNRFHSSIDFFELVDCILIVEVWMWELGGSRREQNGSMEQRNMHAVICYEAREQNAGGNKETCKQLSSLKGSIIHKKTPEI